MEKKRNLLNNTMADVSESEQICCVDNAPDNVDLSALPPNVPKLPRKKEKINEVQSYGAYAATFYRC